MKLIRILRATGGAEVFDISNERGLVNSGDKEGG